MEEKEVYSFSRLNSFHQCRYQWYLSYIKHSKQTNNAFGEYGTFVHEIFEKYALGEYELENLVDIYEWGFDDAVEAEFPPNKYVDLRDSYYETGLEFFKSWEGYDGCEILGVEKHFEIPISDFLLQGFIDIAFIDEDGRYILRDYKSSKNISKNDLQSKIRQPLLYSIYFKEAWGRYPDALQFYTFRNPDKHVVEVEFSEEAMNDAVDWAINTVAQIRDEYEFPQEPNEFFCTSLCGHRNTCEYGDSRKHRKYMRR